jgi:hypothetical protein
MGRRSPGGIKEKSGGLYKLGWEQSRFIGAGGSHTLEPFFNEIADAVIDPQTGVTIKERKICQSNGEWRQGYKDKTDGK